MGDRRHTCLCGCGRTTSVIRKSCTALGLVRGEHRRYIMGHNKLRHGGARKGDHAPEYTIWASMKQRCSDPNIPSYKNYGGRGIKVCDRWQSFANFIADMGQRPSQYHTIERLNNDKGYCPENCAWVPHIDQSRNKRTVKLNTEAVKVIRCMLARGVKQSILAALHKVSQSSISLIGRGINWPGV